MSASCSTSTSARTTLMSIPSVDSLRWNWAGCRCREPRSCLTGFGCARKAAMIIAAGCGSVPCSSARIRVRRADERPREEERALMSAGLGEEDEKLVVLARGAMGRGDALTGAAVRDADGRTYAGAPVGLSALTLTALQ